MKKSIYLNLKRFDVSVEQGGVNALAPAAGWARTILEATQAGLMQYQAADVVFSIFWPESHLPVAADLRMKGHPALVGCQSVAPFDVTPGLNFGAMTTLRSAKAMAALGCETVLIGHCEERKTLYEIMKAGLLAYDSKLADQRGIESALAKAVNDLLAQKLRCATAAGLQVLFCIGESEKQRLNYEEVLRQQMNVLAGIDRKYVTLAYEPIWAVGPGKTPPDREDIQAVARYIKLVQPAVPLVYGGGLKKDNAGLLASIPEIDGGLIALTRFHGEVGFYPEEYVEIIDLYMEGATIL